jgi:hypothetical protein
MTETAIFLGAGASKADGAPLQGELFKEYFSSAAFKQGYASSDRDLATFFQFIFGINVDEDLDGVEFPTTDAITSENRDESTYRQNNRRRTGC